ncbi:MAG: T9SS type A sorting domain-containing protein, partial [Calditrichales bacterium]
NNLQITGLVSGSASTSNNSEVYETALPGFNQCFRMDNSETAPGQCIIIPPNASYDMGNHWTIELWARVSSYGSGKAAYPTIFIKDADGFPSIVLGFDHDGNGFTSAVTFGDKTELSINQFSPVSTDNWYHLALISDSLSRTITLKIHDGEFNPVFSESRNFPDGNDGRIYYANKDILLGGVGGGSNIQFDGSIDELRISRTARDYSIQLPTLQIETERFEFYAENENTAYWDSMATFIDDELAELSDYWDRPGAEPLLPQNEKIKIFLLEQKQLNAYSGATLPKWKRGAFNPSDYSLAVVPAKTGESYQAYGSFAALVKGTLGQLMVKLRYERINFNYTPPYFIEGFGFYRGGYRPQTDSILVAIEKLGRLPLISDIQDTAGLTTSFKKDLIVSYIQFQLLSGMSHQGISSYGYELLWHAYIQYYHQAEADARIRLNRQSEHFDIYCAAQDITFLDSIANRLENRLAFYSSCYDMNLKNRFNVVIFPNEAAGMACMGYGDHYNGGSGCGGDKLDILSPVYFGGGLDEAMLSLVPHEFFHIFHNHMVSDSQSIVGFHAEGLAEMMTYGETTPAYLANRAWYIRRCFNDFESTYGREPNLADFMADADGTLSVYTFGQAFWYFMYTNYADYATIRQFYNQGIDWSVFGVSYEQIESGYISYLKSIGGIPDGIDGGPAFKPLTFGLAQNYPNPFNPQTTIRYTVPEQMPVRLTVFDVLGREVAVLVDEEIPAGAHSVNFDAGTLSSGIYYYQLQSAAATLLQKMVLLR